MAQEIVRDVVILGGGTAGWMTAAALCRALNGKISVTVVESDEIGTVGVGEATIPPISLFNKMLEIDENEFLRETQGTFKLGIEFIDWGKIGERYMHGFGQLPNDIQLASFEQVWQKMHQSGHANNLASYSITKQAAHAGKFTRPGVGASHPLLENFGYAFQFDASLYAKYLRNYSEKRKVKRIEGRVVDICLSDTTGDITGLVLSDGRKVKGQFFVDCSGFRGRLIEEVFKTGYEDWSHWLPCDRAIAVPCVSTIPWLPYTQATARSAGWQWRIPLQHRTGNGYVFSSRYISEDEATATLLANLDGEALAAPRTLRFMTGMRRKAWQRNCVSIGLSGGFLEPLESTSIHLIQTAIARLLAFFPTVQPSGQDIEEYNRLIRREYEHVRDLIILHYHATSRNDAPFWNLCRTMAIPESLRQKIQLYRAHGRIFDDGAGLFLERNWVQVMQGQGLNPGGYDPLVDVIETKDIEEYFGELRQSISQCVIEMPTQQEFIRNNCSAQWPMA